MLYAGSFGTAHDILTVLEAARQLREVPDIAFLLVGEGPLEQQLRRAADDWALRNVVFRPGVPVTALTPYLGAADAGISTDAGSLKERIRSKLYLYMAGQLPLIVTDDGGETRALVTTTKAGCLIPPRDPSAIVARILDLKQRPEHAAALGANGRRFVETHHDRSRLAQAFALVVIHAAQVAPQPESERFVKLPPARDPVRPG